MGLVDRWRWLTVNVALAALVTLVIWSLPALPVIVNLMLIVLAVALLGRWFRWHNIAVLGGALATIAGAADNSHNTGRSPAEIVGNCLIGAGLAAASWAIGLRISRRRLYIRAPE